MFYLGMQGRTDSWVRSGDDDNSNVDLEEQGLSVLCGVPNA